MAKQLDLRVKFDPSTPVAAYGTMFWFRPAALRKLFKHPWAWNNFNGEPHHVDGGLAHVLERLIGYTAQDAGYTTMQVMSEDQASLNYSMLEFKHERMASFMAWDFPWQLHMLENWKKAGYPINPPGEESSGEYRHPLRKALGLGDNYGKVVVQRLVAENHRALDSIVESRPSANEIGSGNRPDQRYLRNLRIEQVRIRCGFGKPLVRTLKRKFHGPATADLETLHVCVHELNNFLNLVRGKVQKGVEQSVRDREILDYIFFAWADGKELCPLFDSEYYAVRYLENETTFNPFAHFLAVGGQMLKDPHPLFDSKFYIGQTSGRTVGNPLIDYLTRGWKEGISPHPLFDVQYYLENNRDVADHGVEPLTHYLVYGGREVRQPHWAFDAKFYLEKNPDVEVSGTNPLLHFVERGVNEGRSPSKDFDVTSYMEHHPHLKTSGANPLVHYVMEVRSRLASMSQAAV